MPAVEKPLKKKKSEEKPEKEKPRRKLPDAGSAGASIEHKRSLLVSCSVCFVVIQ